MKYSFQIRLLKICFTASTLLLASCSPKVYTSASKTYAPRPEGSHVLLYEEDRPVPPAAEPLGKVSVEGTLINNDYAQAVRLASQAVNRTGGNTLRIEAHELPDTYIPRLILQGEMYLLPEPLYASISLSEAQIRPLTPPDAKDNSRLIWDKYRGHTVFFNAGYAFVLTQLFNATDVTGDASRGLDINAGYQWTFESGFGAGLRYSGYFTSLAYYRTKVNIGLHYIAPEFVLRQEFSDRWTVREALGVGYAYYSEQTGPLSSRVSGVGYHLDLSAEYKITRHIGIGIGGGLYSAHFSEMDGWLGTEAANSGIVRISLNGGLRCYF